MARKTKAVTPEAPKVVELEAAPGASALDLFAAPVLVAGGGDASSPDPVLSSPAPSSTGPARQATVTELPQRQPAKRPGGLGASLAKPGMGLLMRTPDGEENVTPFRSLEDLLSAVKPILRSAARSPDPVWFSILPIDLAALDSDAA